MNDTDTMLLQSAQNGDTAAFEKLIEPYMKLVFQIMLKKCGDRHDASRLAQKVFVKVFDSIMTGSCNGDLYLQIMKTAMELYRILL